jgi:hypothetical protein
MVFSYAMVLLSAVNIVLRTIPDLDNEDRGLDNPFYLIEIVTIIWFTIEFTFRLLLCPNKKKFLLTFFTLVDILTVFSYYVYLMVPQEDIAYGFKIVSRVMRLWTLLKAFRKTEALG